ncbi:MAG: DUF3618 domain-containing protein [Kineosporiaceae bacterium]
MSEDTDARPVELPGDPDSLEAEIDRRRRHLAATVDELVARAKPQALAREGAAELSSGLRSAVFTPEGTLRAVRLGAVVAAVVTLVALVLTARRRTGR